MAAIDHDELRRSVRRFMAAEAPPAEVRRLMAHPDGLDRALWRKLAALGLPGLVVPAAHGGAGLGFAELAVALEETGRSLLPAPLLGTALAALVLPRTDGALAGIATGGTIATVALTGDDGSFDPARLDLRYHAGRLTGTAAYVMDGHLADLIVAAADGDDGPALLVLEGGAAGLARTPLDTLDQTRQLARLTFDRTPAVRLVGDVRHIYDLAAAALAAEQAGGAAHCLETAVAYAKARVQFGRPIGAFQAIQHRCADLLLLVESARSAAHHAATVAAAGSGGLPTYAALAKAYCSEAYTRVAAESIQVHGGIGVTWEHEAHLYLKRARSSEVLFGTPARHRERLAELVGIGLSPGEPAC